METLDVIPEISKMVQESSWPGTSYISPVSGKHQSAKLMPSAPPDSVTDLWPINSAKTVEPVSFYTYIYIL